MADAPSDLVLEAFLHFLERETIEHPQRLQPVTTALRERMMSLSAGIDVDLDQPIDGPVSL